MNSSMMKQIEVVLKCARADLEGFMEYMDVPSDIQTGVPAQETIAEIQKILQLIREENTVSVIISGGAVQSIKKPKGVCLEIKDYDIERNDAESGDWGALQDENGDWYQPMFWDMDVTEG